MEAADIEDAGESNIARVESERENVVRNEHVITRSKSVKALLL